MGLTDIVVIVLLVAVPTAVGFYKGSRKKKSGCRGCCGGCSKCRGCGSGRK